MASTADGKYLLVGTDPGLLQLWDVSEGVGVRVEGFYRLEITTRPLGLPKKHHSGSRLLFIPRRVRNRTHIDEAPPGIEDAVQRTGTLFPR
jgi:hypothetical protein